MFDKNRNLCYNIVIQFEGVVKVSRKDLNNDEREFKIASVTGGAPFGHTIAKEVLNESIEEDAKLVPFMIATDDSNLIISDEIKNTNKSGRLRYPYTSESKKPKTVIMEGKADVGVDLSPMEYALRKKFEQIGKQSGIDYAPLQVQAKSRMKQIEVDEGIFTTDFEKK